MESVHKLLAKKSPQEALLLLVAEAKIFMGQVSEQDRLDFVMKLVGDTGADKVGSMVNL